MFFKRSSKPRHREDSELIRLYRLSDDSAYVGELYERYIHLVYGVCLKYLKNQQDSQDAVMQIFEKLLTELKTHEVLNFNSWLHVLAKNHCLMWLRSAKHRREKDTLPYEWENMENDPSAHLTEETTTEEQLAALEKGMQELPTEQKQCVELFYFQQKCYKEIAEITGFDLKKVKSYLQNGKRNLKIYLANKDDG